jgi:hypothetical protein
MGYGESVRSARAREQSIIANRRENTLWEIAGVAPVAHVVEADGVTTGLEWQEDGLCRQVDPDGLFVKGAAQTEAKKICSGCPVISECLDYALDNDIQHGVWGGMTEYERRKLKKNGQRSLRL